MSPTASDFQLPTSYFCLPRSVLCLRLRCPPPRAIAPFALNLHRHLISQIVDALADIFIYGFYTDKVIERRFKLHPKWGARDRRQVAETIYEIVRWWRWHWHLAGLPDAECLDKEKITQDRIWQVWGAYWITKTGSAASLYEVERMDVEAVQARATEIVAPAIRASMPDWLNELGKKELGSEWPDLVRALNRPADVFLRTNTLKIQPKPLSINLDKEGIENKLLPDVPDAIQLVKRQSVFASSAFRAGLFEVQDAASQQIAPFLDVSPGQRVIDACAGAGGKSLHLGCLMKNKGKIVALDIHEWKLKELRKRSTRQGIDIIDTRVMEDIRIIKRLHNTADRVLLDVPCSGLGVLRRNPDCKWKLSIDELNRLRPLQAEILRDYCKMVKPGGKLVYATCSVLPSENEDQIKSFLAEHGDEWTLEEERRWKPHANGFDGFYAARLVRKAAPPAAKPVVEAAA